MGQSWALSRLSRMRYSRSASHLCCCIGRSVTAMFCELACWQRDVLY